MHPKTENYTAIHHLQSNYFTQSKIMLHTHTHTHSHYKRTASIDEFVDFKS